MESSPSKKKSRDSSKVPQYEDILNEELKNAKKTMFLPERFMFLPNHVAEAASEHEKKLEEHHGTVMREFKDHYDRGSGDTPMVVQGVQSEQGQRGLQGERGEQGLRGPAGPAPNLDPVIREMQSQLDQAEAVRAKAGDQELQEKLSRLRAEQARQAETARVLAEMQANLTSIPSELRAVAEAQLSRPVIDVRTHMQESCTFGPAGAE